MAPVAGATGICEVRRQIGLYAENCVKFWEGQFLLPFLLYCLSIEFPCRLRYFPRGLAESVFCGEDKCLLIGVLQKLAERGVLEMMY